MAPGKNVFHVSLAIIPEKIRALLKSEVSCNFCPLSTSTIDQIIQKGMGEKSGWRTYKTPVEAIHYLERITGTTRLTEMMMLTNGMDKIEQGYWTISAQH